MTEARRLSGLGIEELLNRDPAYCEALVGGVVTHFEK
jgi:hypothetical protein